ncbi:metallophosphoesterase [Psychromonas sp.]|uniref:metallophosphoesterase n=1 Tax=Psychromonas sp. TaxID=1884585 RepID=UPI003569A573
MGKLIIQLLGVLFFVQLVACNDEGNQVTVASNSDVLHQLPDAGEEVDSSAIVYLASGDIDVDGSITDYQWTQTKGTSVEILNADSANASFVMPVIFEGDLLGFQLVATDSEGSTNTYSTSITVEPVSVKIAFIGDSGVGDGAKKVLQLIAAEGTDMVLHQGDFGYNDYRIGVAVDLFFDQIAQALGEKMPYFGSIGNHDHESFAATDEWLMTGGYQEGFQTLLKNTAGAKCEGDLGVASACTYKGIFFVLSGIGTYPDGRDGQDDPTHVAYLQEKLAASSATWKICSWHKTMSTLQVGGKHDETGWAPFSTCRKAGAIVAVGHEHSYSRTHVLSNFETQTVVSTNSKNMKIKGGENGETFMFVSGLGGKSIRDQERTTNNEHWASIYTSTQGATYGALFCTFRSKGDPDRADCYFKNIAGQVIDEFTIFKEEG